MKTRTKLSKIKRKFCEGMIMLRNYEKNCLY